MVAQRSGIKHIVQLMLENRSFDQMLGFLYAEQNNLSPAGQEFDGLTGNESCPDPSGREVKVFRIESSSPHAYLMPGGDPGEGFYNTNTQLFGTAHPAASARPSNKGFVTNFKTAIASDLAKHFADTLPGTVPSEIMGAYAPEALPVLSALARGYAVCDRWFASVPTQTVPNRAFAAAATSQGRLDNHVKSFTCQSIFGRLSSNNTDWAIYGYNRSPLTRTDFHDTLYADSSHYGLFPEFVRRAATGQLPAYTFLEPSWSSDGNSQHPNYNVAAGERLIRDVYRAVRASPAWPDTLLLITYDEHGGNYDHVAPPDTAVPPDDTRGEFDDFNFKRFGLRIPAVLISPRIPAGTVFRPSSGTIDHTSVLKTIEELWDVPPLTKRDAAAPSLQAVVSLHAPRADDPLHGVVAPSFDEPHPHAARPSKLEQLHAWRVSQLPMPNEHGYYEHGDHEHGPHAPLSAALSDRAALHGYIEGRMARWDSFLRARHNRSPK